METLEAMNRSAKRLFDRIGIEPEETDWQSIHDETPDDIIPGEDGTKPVKASDASELDSLTARMKDLEAKVNEGKLIDEDSIAAILAAAWVSGAKEPTNDK